jgi:hypothetical protein
VHSRECPGRVTGKPEGDCGPEVGFREAIGDSIDRSGLMNRVLFPDVEVAFHGCILYFQLPKRS